MNFENCVLAGLPTRGVAVLQCCRQIGKSGGRWWLVAATTGDWLVTSARRTESKRL